jgi:hypothetical protein
MAFNLESIRGESITGESIRDHRRVTRCQRIVSVKIKGHLIAFNPVIDSPLIDSPLIDSPVIDSIEGYQMTFYLYRHNPLTSSYPSVISN